MYIPMHDEVYKIMYINQYVSSVGFMFVHDESIHIKFVSLFLTCHECRNKSNRYER